MFTVNKGSHPGPAVHRQQAGPRDDCRSAGRGDHGVRSAAQRRVSGAVFTSCMDVPRPLCGHAETEYILRTCLYLMCAKPSLSALCKTYATRIWISALCDVTKGTGDFPELVSTPLAIC